MIATAVHPMTTFEFGDMNGPLAYWGPTETAAAAAPGPRREIVVSERDRAAVARLGETLNGRTWAGTNALMSTLFAALEREPAMA